MCGSIFCHCHTMTDKMYSLFVFVWFAFCRSLASLSSFSSLIPCTLLFCLLKHRPHCCSHRGKASADLFCLYCRRQRGRQRGRESVLERRRGCDSDCSVWQRPSPVGVGRRERRLVFCLWQSGKSCHGESLGLPSGFLRLFRSQPAFEILSVTEHNTLAAVTEQTTLPQYMFFRHLRYRATNQTAEHIFEYCTIELKIWQRQRGSVVVLQHSSIIFRILLKVCNWCHNGNGGQNAAHCHCPF